MKNRLITLIFAILIIGLSGVGGYYYKSFQLKKESKKTETRARPKIISSERVVSPVLSFDEEKIWYFTKGGKLYRSSLDGKTTAQYQLPDRVENPVKVLWQDSGTDFILEQNLDGHTRYTFYDSEKNKFVGYPAKARKPKFSASEGRVVYDWGEGEEHKLTSALADGTDYKKLSDLYPATYEIEASQKVPEVALFSSSVQDEIKLSVFDTKNLLFTDLGDRTAYGGVKFSPNGKLLVAAKLSGASGETRKLTLFDIVGQSERDLNFSANIEQVVWQDDQTLLVGDKNGFTKIDTGTGQQSSVYSFDKASAFTPRDLLLKKDHSVLFFVDSGSGHLYSLDLK